MTTGISESTLGRHDLTLLQVFSASYPTTQLARCLHVCCEVFITLQLTSLLVTFNLPIAQYEEYHHWVQILHLVRLDVYAVHSSLTETFLKTLYSGLAMVYVLGGLNPPPILPPGLHAGASFISALFIEESLSMVDWVLD